MSINYKIMVKVTWMCKIMVTGKYRKLVKDDTMQLTRNYPTKVIGNYLKA